MSEIAPLPLGLDDPSDDEHDKQLNATMQGLVDGEIEAVTAARTIHTLVIDDCEEGYSTGNNGDGQSPATASGTGWIGYLWRTVGKVAMAVPSHHAGQTRLVAFLQELFRLPPHTIRFQGHEGNVWETTFWEDAKKDGQFGEEMRLLDSDANPRNMVAYLNFTAFMARVFAGGVMDTTRFSELSSNPFLGLYWPYNQQAGQSEPYVLAAAEWMTHAAAAMWEVCERKAYASRAFNAGWWARWEARFQRVAEDDSGFSPKAREAAVGALKQMEMAQDGRLAGPSVIESLGLAVKDWGDDDDE